MTDDRRPPPVRVRITGLQEAQLPLLVQLEQRTAELRTEGGVSEDLARPFDDRAILSMLRTHDLRVLEADHEPSGYLAWHDEAPGVAIVDRLLVEPSLQRYGLGTRLLREVGEKASAHGIEVAVIVVPAGDAPAALFLGKRGFTDRAPEPDRAPAALVEWLAGRLEAVAPSGTTLWWGRTDGLGTIPGLPPPVPTW